MIYNIHKNYIPQSSNIFTGIKKRPKINHGQLSISLRHPTMLAELQHLLFHIIGGDCKSSGTMGARGAVTVEFYIPIIVRKAQSDVSLACTETHATCHQPHTAFKLVL